MDAKKMWRKFYIRYVAPRQEDEDTRNREYVLNILLLGTFAAMLAALIVLLNSYFMLGNSYVGIRIVSVLIMLALVGGLYWLSRTGRFKVAVYSLVALYFLIAVGVSLSWGIAMPVTVLLLGLVIVLASILIGARYSLYAACTVILVMAFMKVAELQEWIRPDWTWTDRPSNAGTLVGIALVFGVIAVVSWLFNYRMERSLRRAERAEAALKRQKDQLERTVEKRTQQLQAAQLEKVQELYRFAELGQLSTALVHDLANHLTVLNSDIENLGTQKRSHLLQRAKRSMQYLDNMVVQVRDQLHGKVRARPFSAATEIKTVNDLLRHKAAQAQVSLNWESPADKKELRTYGDPLRFRQLLINIISNGIDACKAGAVPDKPVRISAASKGRAITIRVEDWGKGIKPQDRAKLFEPFYGDKKDGLGLGLFIARQIARDHFGGDVTLSPDTGHTTFIIILKVHA